MTLSPGRSAVAPLITLTLTMRIVCGLSLDMPDALNATWMCPLLGLVFFLPVCCVFSQMSGLDRGSPMDNLSKRMPGVVLIACKIIFTLLLALDAAAMVRLTASSCNVLSLNNEATPYQIVPLSLAIAFVVRLGLDALGNSARLWLKILAGLLLIVFILQLKGYDVYWLAPILGSGAAGILNGGIYCAGCMALLTLPWMLATPDRNQKGLTRYALLSALAASLMLISLQMLYPVQIGGTLTRAARIALLLCNGRLSLSPQLFLNMIWYGGMLYLIAAETTTGAALLRSSFPRARKWIWAPLVLLSSFLLPLINPKWFQEYPNHIGLMFIAIGAVLALMMIFALHREEAEHA